MENKFTETAAALQAVRDNIAKVIVGKDDTVRLLLTAMIAGGHVLLEDVPGTGKTVLAKTLAKSVESDFRRIQFTPDLLPSDVTGLSVYQADTGSFEFRPGPVFTNILLADEINRATPRTQAGLLECMEEHQVTVDGNTRKLAEPFFVIATQNPIETSGTFPLPEAQLDRFLFRLSMGLPGTEEETAILSRFLMGDASEKLNNEISPVTNGEVLVNAKALAKTVRVHADVLAYMTSLIIATRNRDDVTSGVSPRGSLALLRASQALALLNGRDYVVPEDVKELAVPVLAHRLILAQRYGQAALSEQIIRDILDKTPVPTENFGPEGN